MRPARPGGDFWFESWPVCGSCCARGGARSRRAGPMVAVSGCSGLSGSGEWGAVNKSVKLRRVLASFLTTILFSISVVCGHRSAKLIGGTAANFWRLTLATLMLGVWAYGPGSHAAVRCLAADNTLTAGRLLSGSATLATAGLLAFALRRRGSQVPFGLYWNAPVNLS